VAGAIVIIAILVLVIPVLVMLSGALAAAVLGWLLVGNAEATHEGSELIDCNT
jgi:hypothetical protein